MPRLRQQQLSIAAPGSYSTYITSSGEFLGKTYTAGAEVDWQKYSTDDVMPPPYNVDHNLWLRSQRVDPLRLFGSMPSGWPPGYTYVLDGANFTNRTASAYVSLGSDVNWTYYATKALARMNPSTPTVDLPLFLFEFKDFPSMLKNLGDILARRIKPKTVAEGYLAYSFGWKPLVADLTKLFDIQKGIERRLAYLRRLEHGARVSGTLEKTSGTSVVADGAVYFDAGGNIAFTSDIENTESRKVWFTANAKLLDPLPPPNQQYDLARDAFLGRNVSLATAWNAVPWSWLIDYFANVGDVLDAQRGFIRSQCTSMNIMCHTETVSKLTNIRCYSGISSSGGTFWGDSKARQVFINPTPRIAFDPILTGGQVANLGALVTAKALKRL